MPEWVLEVLLTGTTMHDVITRREACARSRVWYRWYGYPKHPCSADLRAVPCGSGSRRVRSSMSHIEQAALFANFAIRMMGGLVDGRL
jgi:hypothetical protein